MTDRMKPKGISLDIPHLEMELKTKIVLVSTRKGIGIDDLKNQIVDYKSLSTEPCLNASSIDVDYFDKLRRAFPNRYLGNIQIAPLGDPIYLNVNNGSHLAIRKEMAREIEVEIHSK